MEISASDLIRVSGINPHSEEANEIKQYSDDWSGVGDVEVDGFLYVVVSDEKSPTKFVLKELERGIESRLENQSEGEIEAALRGDANSEAILDAEIDEGPDYHVIYTTQGVFHVKVEQQFDQESRTRWAEIMKTTEQNYGLGKEME